MDQESRIGEKLQQLGYDLSSTDLSSIAYEHGIRDIKTKKGLNAFENVLDKELYERNNRNAIAQPKMNDSFVENLYPQVDSIPKVQVPQQNEHSSKENFREQVGEKIDDFGAEALEELTGLPKELGKKAVKLNRSPVVNKARNVIADKLYDIKNRTGIDNDKINEDFEDNADEVEKAVNQSKNKVKGKLKGKRERESVFDGVAFLKKFKWFFIIGGILIFVFIIFIVIIIVILESENKKNNNNYVGDVSYFYSEVCDGFNFNSTSLSKGEFVDKLKAFYAFNTNSYAREFINNAETIYDISLKNGINPELVVTRAHAEGYSPSGYRVSLASYNNYWGINCTNGSDLVNCSKYNSFDEGLMAYINIISKSDSVSTMMKSYSYLGTYWYNPGNSGIGGCYYLESIKPYLSESRYNEIKNICAGDPCSKDNTSKCVKTTEEDQNAYSLYQTQHMIDYRARIFGIGADDCSGYSSSCTIYAQGDSKWKSTHLGSSSATMGGEGCLVTAIAIGISCSGTELTVENFDAGVLVDAMNKKGCFGASGDLLSYSCSAISEIAPNISYVKRITVLGMSNEVKNNYINEIDLEHNFILLRFKNEKHRRGHFVVYTKTQGNNYIVKDPGNGKTGNVSIGDVYEIHVYSF